MLHNFKYFIVNRKDLSDQSKDMHLIFDSGQNVLFNLSFKYNEWNCLEKMKTLTFQT